MPFSVQNLACQRADQLIFEKLSFTLAPGEAIWVQGRNGAGKSSLLRICARLLRPAAGQICWQGEDIFKDAEVYGAASHYVGHQDALKSVMTVRENISFWAEYHGAADVDTALQDFELEKLADTPAGLLSQGQKKRSNLARLAASQATLWILDEPLSALDRHFIELFRDRLQRHLEAGGMAIFATHQDLGLEGIHHIDLDGGGG
ncbi:MAG: heme ABC transporter ATP-binding protein CcmA [Sneathiella sp.]|jgi:heme exporter protein A|uniref:heme ABC exporter ATP-binding protein CcmA n=1 Tax=Sneathiella sp. TaxID=1964365 RepID=UPI000C3D0DF3|nr:heme ABC exporter ATP-binding protein CcmA [Sneathiella sp.]MAL78990.1 heme ABC transporter ATP-binding protein CcmA [Sneathiella sp.]|tara:strand:- start:217 stop:828 length:612 start_codon:yes stop_codon:yes gene_type:complete